MTSSRSPLAADALRAGGLRVTGQRRAVYDALARQPHASADDLHARVLADAPGISLQSVYNVLGDFVSAGIARRIEPAGHCRLYELRIGDNHHHLVCSECGAITDVDCAIGAAPCLEPADTHGFTLRSAEVTYWGVCPACAGADAPDEPRSPSERNPG